MNLIDEIILGEAKKKDSSYQRRGPTPGGEGGSDTGKRHQPLACPHSTAGSVRRMVQGSPPPGTMPMSGEKFESDEQGQAMSDYLMGRPPKRGKKKKKKVNDSFESCLMSAIFSNEEMLLEFTSKNWERRGHVKKMSRGRKLLIGGALAAALAAGVVGSKGKQDTGPTDQQTTHQTQGHSGQGASGELDDRPTSMGRGRVTTDKDLGIGKKKSKTPWGDKHGPYDPAKHGKYDPDLPGPTGKGPDPRNR